ncbi:phosphatidylinositol-specific phospholipase C domain-containing protein [Bacillus thuringiensis]|uniref:phosphatidylinositol-specific phospholipase C domain-containing protein n=1 Tax=Bacillus thuringiensis TaxID=1428 RepID=UPI000ED6465C|nr:phosphatidylinositol-specific phospholipase C domain-containing protein [Bacillus thuringiensis]MDZ3952426.1 phosphatidylinositol-specific phospholipase C domain-containing protein [Bacillus thuringiensis]RGP45243.1 hypothetical protein BTW32_26165 [Bacillus thuringiensis]
MDSILEKNDEYHFEEIKKRRDVPHYKPKVELINELAVTDNGIVDSAKYYFEKTENIEKNIKKFLIHAIYLKRINGKELETITWRWNGSVVYGYGVKLDRYESDLKIIEDDNVYKVNEFWNGKFYPAIDEKYYFTFKNYYNDGTANNYEYVYDEKSGEIQLEEQYNSVFPIENVVSMVRDGHKFKKWEIGTCLHTDEEHSENFKYYTLGVRFKGVSSYILNQIKCYKISINGRAPVMQDSYLIDEQGEVKMDLLNFHDDPATTLYNHIKMLVITKNGGRIFIFEGYTDETDFMIGSNEKGYAYESDIEYVNQEWMSKISGEKQISELSIPGTHRSVALYGITGFDEDWTRNQKMSIATQLNSGIRYFDIHARCTNKGFAMQHGQVYQNLQFEDVLNQICTFLEQHPNETILMKLKEEHTAESGSQTFEQILMDYWNSYKHYFWEPTSQNPKLKDVRGKIIIIKDFSSSKLFGIAYSTLSVQDVYKVNHSVAEMYGKWKEVEKHLIRANNSKESMIYLNYLSADSLEGFGDIVKGAEPWFVASGYISRNTDTFAANSLNKDWRNKYSDYPKDIGGNVLYKGTNLMTTECIHRRGLQHVGIIAADFPGKGLIDRIIKLNLKYSSSDILCICSDENGGIKVVFTGDVYLRKHYQIEVNGRYIVSVENGVTNDGVWTEVDFGHELMSLGANVSTGDVIQVYVLDKGEKLQIASHTVSSLEKEFQKVKIPDGIYTITSILNNTSVVDLSKTSSRDITLRSYRGEQIEGEWKFEYVGSRDAYRITNCWNTNLVLGCNVYDIENRKRDHHVFGAYVQDKSECYWSILHTAGGDGAVYLQNSPELRLEAKNKIKRRVLDVQFGDTSNGTNIHVRDVNKSNQQKWRINTIPSRVLQVQIDSDYKPLEGQRHRSSGNFSLDHVPPNKKIRIEIEGDGAENLSFRIMKDLLCVPDPAIWSGVKHGSVIIMSEIPEDRNNLYIADPEGHRVNGTFKVKFYLL